MNKDEILLYIKKVLQKIGKIQDQWKGRRFASLDDSILDPQQQNENQYQQFLQKYRGKNGSIKPLGLILYNQYLRILFLLFLILTLLYVPVTMVYSFGNGLSQMEIGFSFSKSILLLSIANLPHYQIDDLTDIQITQINFHRYLTLTCDIISIFVIFAFIFFLKVKLSKITNDYVAKSPPPQLYCIQVSNIQKCSEKCVLQHFEKLGKVSQISSIYTLQNIIFDLQKIIKLISYLQTLKPDEQRYQKIIQKIIIKYNQLMDNYFIINKPQLKSVFICFQSIKDRNRIYDLYKYGILSQKLNIVIQKYHHQIQQRTQQQICQSKTSKFLSKQSINSLKILDKSTVIKTPNTTIITNSQCEPIDPIKYQTVYPIVKKCKFQPLTLNWQNSDIDICQQRVKFCLQFILLVIVAFVILLALFLLNINSSQIKQTTYLIQNTNLISKQTDIKSNPIINTQKNILCTSLSVTQLKWKYYSQCTTSTNFIEEKNKFILMLFFSLLVALINLLTNRILWALVAFRRYRTLAQRNNFLITYIFIFSLINSALLILFVRGQYSGPILRFIVGKILNFQQNQMKVTVYNQFGRKWYMNIGSQLIMNYFVSLIIIPHFHIVLHWIRSKYRQFIEKHKKKAMKKPNFNYCTFYALSLKAIFFALIYSNCMPIFYPLCCVALVVQIILGKVLLKYFVDQPVFVDNNAINVTTNLIPYALLFHCLTSILFLNVEQIFPTMSSKSNIYNSWTKTNLLKFQRGFIYVLIFVVIAIYIWNRSQIDKTVINYWLRSQEQTKQQRKYPKFKQIKLNPAFLASYKMKDNPKYKIVYYALNLFCERMQKIREKVQIQKNEQLQCSRICQSQKTGIGLTQTQTYIKKNNILQTQPQLITQNIIDHQHINQSFHLQPNQDQQCQEYYISEDQNNNHQQSHVHAMLSKNENSQIKQ